MIVDVLYNHRLAISPVWNGYLVAVHASVYMAGVMVALALPRRSASMTRGIYGSALAGALAVTLLCWFPSGWWEHLLPGALAAPLIWIGGTGIATSVEPGSRALWPMVIVYLTWVVGLGLILVRLAIAYASVLWTTVRATRLESAEWMDALNRASVMLRTRRRIELRVSDSISTPMTWGLVNPVILLPAESADWTPRQRELVLLHELAHVRSRDSLAQLAAQLSVAWYWFHPGVWWLARRWRGAREAAADAAVIAAGVRPSEYAELLLSLARTPRAQPRLIGAAALTLDGGHGLTRRITTVLSDARPLRAPTLVRVTAASACVAWMLIVGLIRLTPQRSVTATALESTDWARRAYAVSFISGRDLRPSLEAVAATDPHPVVRRMARRTSQRFR